MKAFIEVALMWGMALAVVLAVFLLNFWMVHHIEILVGASHRNSGRCISCPWNHHGICGNGYGMDTEFWR